MFPLIVFAYSDETTHPALTQETIKFFNLHYPALILSPEEAELVIQGSIDEDKEARWLQHFYDPVYNRGLVLENDAFPKNPELAVIASSARIPFLSSKSWALSSRAQGGVLNFFTAGIVANYYRNENDFSWERSIYEYAWGNKDIALLSLGHVLHLIQDASVPDHTRNDPHPPYLDLGSPYEGWTKKFDRRNIKILPNEKPIFLSTLSDHFDSLANYSNNNFFSKDTVCQNKYKFPKEDFERDEVLSNGKTYFFGYKYQSGELYRLMARSAQSNWFEEKNKQECVYFLDDNDDLILSDYWTLLSKQAVLHGAGVIKLFFDEMEKERQTKVLYDKNRSWLTKQVDNFKSGTFKVASVLYGITAAQKDLEDTAINEPEQEPETPFAQVSNLIPEPEIQLLEIEPVILEKVADTQPIVINFPPAPPPPILNTPSSDTSSDIPIAGAAGPVPSPEPEEETPTPDTTPPDISLTISECGSSLSADSCLIATTTVTLSWSSIADDFNYFDISCTSGGSSCSGFTSGTTTATSTTYTLPADDASYTFSAKAIDTTGNESSPATTTVSVSTKPVIINEIAWAGTSAAQDQDEWIELYNRTNQTVSLTNWVLYSATDNGPYIELSGTIAPKSFFILERTDESTIASSTANQIYTEALGNSGEKLNLSISSTTIDSTPEVSTCSGWCGGQANPNYYTMERYDPNSSGELASNWSSWAGFLNNGLNADGENIKGTPARRNSINYLITKDAGPLNQNKTLTQTNSPYIVSNNFAIGNTASSTLTVEPGVVIKFLGDASITVSSGKITAQGTAANQIVFTSIKDDGYAGDTNQDESATSAGAGDWRGLRILADGSIFDRTLFRYGGANVSDYQANLRVENASTTITNSVFEYARDYGAWLKAATTTISGNTFQNNSTTTSTIGLLVTDGEVTIQNNTFSSNSYGLRVNSAGALHAININNNTFSGNTYEAIDINSSFPSFSGNTASNNGTNGILYQGTVSRNYTFAANLPYKISTGLGVNASTTLTLDAGVVLKFTNSGSLTVQGNLIANGTSANKVIFTSIKDDAYGGDTNNDGTTTAPAKADWSQVHLENATATSTIANATFSYGTTGLKLTNSAATLDSVLFKTNTTGIQAVGTSSVDATGVTFENNTNDDDPASLIP